MPKRHDTRKQRAQLLQSRLTEGPVFDDTFVFEFTPEEAKRGYSLWVRTWVLPELKRQRSSKSSESPAATLPPYWRSSHEPRTRHIHHPY